MRITILTVGSRGDIQPFIALGKGLREAGFQIRLPAPPVFEKPITSAGLEYVPAESVDPQAFLRRANLQSSSSRQIPLVFLVRMFHEAQGMMRKFFEESWRLSQNSDAIIANIIFFGAQSCAERMNIPFFIGAFGPTIPTREFPSIVWPFSKPSIGGLNLFSHTVMDQGLWLPFRAYVNEWRKRDLGLTPYPFFGPYKEVRNGSVPHLLGYSNHVLPRPSDWNSSMHVTGYWFAEDAQGWTPPSDLMRFLEEGPAPVYVGFGSMVDRNPERITSVIVDALQQSNQRAILASGWAGLGERPLPPNIYRVDSIPHAWLFDRVTAIVHHGGAGTTAAGLRAGVPQVIVPFSGDQPFWGRRIRDLGVGTAPIPIRDCSAHSLASAIDQATLNLPMREKAKQLGIQIRAERGVEKAIEIIRKEL